MDDLEVLFLLSEAAALVLLPDVGAPVDHCVVGLACPAQVRHGLGCDDIGQQFQPSIQHRSDMGLAVMINGSSFSHVSNTGLTSDWL